MAGEYRVTVIVRYFGCGSLLALRWASWERNSAFTASGSGRCSKSTSASPAVHRLRLGGPGADGTTARSYERSGEVFFPMCPETDDPVFAGDPARASRTAS